MERLQIKAIKKAGRKLTMGISLATQKVPLQKHKYSKRKTTHQWLKEANNE